MHLIDHETVENAYLFVFSTLFFVSHKNSFFQSDTIPSQSLLVTKACDTSWPANILPNNGLLVIIILIFIKADHQMLMLMLSIDKNRKERARASESKVRIDHIKKVLFIYLGTLSRSKAEVYIYSSFWWCFLITKRSQAKVFFLKIKYKRKRQNDWPACGKICFTHPPVSSSWELHKRCTTLCIIKCPLSLKFGTKKSNKVSKALKLQSND